jgi:hypothetical protein
MMVHTTEREFEIAQINYSKGDICKHLFKTDPFRIPKCDFTQVDCKVCGKIMERIYDD